MKLFIIIAFLTISIAGSAQININAEGIILATDSIIRVEGVKYKVREFPHPLGKQYIQAGKIRITWNRKTGVVAIKMEGGDVY